MRINAITQPLSAELRKVESAKKTDKDSRTSRAAAHVDRSEFSANGTRLSATKAQFETISASVAAQPDIRPERVAEVKQKIQRGFYDSSEFIDKLADKLLAEFGMKPPES